MKATRMLAAGIAVAALLPAAASAQELATVTLTTLNMRAGPGPQFPIVTTIPTNTTLVLYGCTEDRSWCDVGWNNNRGWSYAAYLTYQMAATTTPQLTPAPQTAPPMVIYGGAQVQVPTVTYNQTYFDQNYANQPFYTQRDRLFDGAAGGAGVGAVIGALIAGPLGAAIGAGIGGGVGVVADAAIVVPNEIRTYVIAQPPTPVLLNGEVVIGAQVPTVVTLNPIPNYNYASAYINGQWVIVDPTSRLIVGLL